MAIKLVHVDSLMHAMATQRYPDSILFAVSVVWNGTVVTGPILIYHDEITDDLTTVPTVGNSNIS